MSESAAHILIINKIHSIFDILLILISDLRRSYLRIESDLSYVVLLLFIEGRRGVLPFLLFPLIYISNDYYPSHMISQFLVSLNLLLLFLQKNLLSEF
jgi:hypothetical protein